MEGSSRYITRTWADEGERMTDMTTLLAEVNGSPQPIMDEIFFEFSAKYLPAAVDRFIEASFPVPPSISELHNVHFNVLKRLQASPYFTKYLRSEHPIALPGNKLGHVVAGRLATMATLHRGFVLNPGYAGPLSNALELLVYVLVVFTSDQEPVPPEVKRVLVPFFEDCQGSSHQTLKETSKGLLNMLVHGYPADPNPERDDYRKLIRGRNKCKLPGCDITAGLKTCAR
ncbi:hypothetical protein BDN72DRAFT_91783 [Pluteus cervinus]|uniref:Uncharacterized protein n=1 Tax=Pluteus cervinus TaxID=181527 RepID=A0ACD3AQP5_9AGAR|nr:hypothetical protein BDN72DRAFT_91783 [Pluteus cervinus]